MNKQNRKKIGRENNIVALAQIKQIGLKGGKDENDKRNNR